jgi:TPR repeat protein
MPPSEPNASSDGAGRKKKAEEAKKKKKKNGDITTLDFATFFDSKEAPQHPNKRNGSETTSSSENGVSNEDTPEEMKKKQPNDTGDATSANASSSSSSSSPDLKFSEHHPTKLAKVVQQIDNQNDSDGETALSKDDGYEPDFASSGGSSDAGQGTSATENEQTNEANDERPSSGEFVADFGKEDAKLEELTELEATSASSNDENLVEHATSVEEAISEEENDSQSGGDDYRRIGSMSSEGSSGSVSEDEETAPNEFSGENSTSDAANEATQEAAEVQSRTTTSTYSSQSIDFATYDRVAALLLGMNREQIDWTAAQQMVSVASRHDAVLSGFKSLLLHPEFYKDGRLHKHESDALRAWIKALDLGLLDQVEEGNAWAQLLKGMFRHAEDKDYASAKRYYELAAEQGNALAQHNLGLLYEKGIGVRQDSDKAKEKYELAAAQGHANAQCSLGGLYLGGKGVPKDYERARHYFELAAEQGHAWAQYKLGLLYMEGTGVDQDYEKAKQNYEKAVEQGFALAQCNLASMYVKGTGVPEDYERARHLYELAVEQGCAEAQNNLGHLYKNGIGVPQDYEKAKKYYELAARQGFAAGQSSLDSLDQSSCVVS